MVKKKQPSDEDKLFKLIKEKGIENNPERNIQVITTNDATLVLVNNYDLYSVEWDFLTGRHYLLKLSCPESIKKPIVKSQSAK